MPRHSEDLSVIVRRSPGPPAMWLWALTAGCRVVRQGREHTEQLALNAGHRALALERYESAARSWLGR
jgi:hypothetical protein